MLVRSTRSTLPSLGLALSLLPLLPAAPGLAQASAQPPLPPSSPTPDGSTSFTLRTQSRIVLLDVTATDRNGEPFPHLPETAFHVTDNREPQSIRYFEEHTPEAQAPAEPPVRPHPPGVYTNDFVLHAPPVLNILMLDISNLAIVDQLTLHVQLERLLDALPADQPLAVYTRSSGAGILLQDFTTDRSLLRAATRRAVPRLTPSNPYLDDFYTLAQITSAVGQLPGRKNLIWFTGGAPLGVLGGVGLSSQLAASRDNGHVRAIYDALEAARIAVYPIDARGLTVAAELGQQIQHAQMDDVAEATGGHAIYNNNGLATGALGLLRTDRSFYTLTYTPRNFHADNKWHTVRVSVDDPNLRLSYRRGYFSDSNVHSGDTPAPPDSRTRLAKDGTVHAEPAADSAPPIVFQAEVLPWAETAARTAPAGINPLTLADHIPRGRVPYRIRYTVPGDSFAVQTVDGAPALVLDVAALAFNLNGTVVARLAQRLTVHLNPERLPLRPGLGIPLDQQLALPKGTLTLYLAVVDTGGGRVGTLQIPLEVREPGKR